MLEGDCLDVSGDSGELESYLVCKAIQLIRGGTFDQSICERVVWGYVLYLMGQKDYSFVSVKVKHVKWGKLLPKCTFNA